MKINFEDSFFWIYFTTDKVVCFTCNAEGHLQKHCQNVDVSKPEQSINNQTSMETRKITNNEQNKEENIISESNISMFPPLLPHNRAKRPSSTNASVISAPENKVNNGVTTKSTRKKTKLGNDGKHTIEEVKEKLEPAKTYIDDNFNVTNMDFDTLSNLMLETYGNNNIENIITKYNQDPETLKNYLLGMKMLLDRHMKTKITKINKKLSAIFNLDWEK